MTTEEFSAWIGVAMLVCVVLWSIPQEIEDWRMRHSPSRKLLKAAEGAAESFKRGYDMARHTQKVVRTRSIEDLTDEEFDAIMEGLRIIVAVSEDPDDEDEPSVHYHAAKRLHETLGDVSVTLPMGGGGGSGMPAPAISDDDPRGGPEDPVGMPTRSPSGTGGGVFKRRRD